MGGVLRRGGKSSYRLQSGKEGGGDTMTKGTEDNKGINLKEIHDYKVQDRCILNWGILGMKEEKGAFHSHSLNLQLPLFTLIPMSNCLP